MGTVDNGRVAAPFFALLVAGATWLVVAKTPRLAPWFLCFGALLFGFLWLLGQLRIPWPDLGVPTVFLLNPYLWRLCRSLFSSQERTAP